MSADLHSFLSVSTRGGDGLRTGQRLKVCLTALSAAHRSQCLQRSIHILHSHEASTFLKIWGHNSAPFDLSQAVYLFSFHLDESRYAWKPDLSGFP